MNSVAFAAHKSYMDEGHRMGVLYQLDWFFHLIITGNNSHIRAINTHLTAAFYDRAAFQTELDTLRSRSNIVTRNAPTFGGALNKLSRGRVDITPFTKSLSVCTDRIRVLEEKLGQIESYLAATSRIYEQAELSLGRAQRELARLEMANRCLSTASPTLPTWGEVDITMRQRAIDAMNLRNEDYSWNWDNIEALAGRPNGLLDELDIAALAGVLMSIDNNDDLAMFISLLADPFNGSVRGHTLWTFCNEKFHRILLYSSAMIAVMPHMRRESGDEFQDELYKIHTRMIQNFAVVEDAMNFRGETTERFDRGNNWVPQKRETFSFVLVGNAGMSRPNISIDPNNPDNFIFNTATHTLIESSSVSNHISHHRPRTIEVSNVSTGLRGAEDFFGNTHELLSNSFGRETNAVGILLEAGAGEVIAAGVAAGIGAFTPVGWAGLVAGGVMVVASSTANIIQSENEARQTANEIARVSNQIAGNFNTLVIAGRFGLHAAATTDANGNRTVRIFEGAYTQRIVDVYNELLSQQTPAILFNDGNGYRQLTVDDILNNMEAVANFTGGFVNVSGLNRDLETATWRYVQ